MLQGPKTQGYNSLSPCAFEIRSVLISFPPPPVAFQITSNKRISHEFAIEGYVSRKYITWIKMC